MTKILTARFSDNMSNQQLLTEFTDMEHLAIVGRKENGDIFVGWSQGLWDLEAAGMGALLTEEAMKNMSRGG